MSDNMSAIDKAIQAAKARKAAKQGVPVSEVEDVAAVAKPAREPRVVTAKEPKAKKDDSERAAAKLQRDTERASKQAARKVERAAKKAEKLAAKSNKTPHMSKVERAAAKLPQLSDAAQMSFNDITVNLDAASVAALAEHLMHFNRVQATTRALTQKLAEGDQVRILSGCRYVGSLGTVTKAQRIRCYIDIGREKPIYLFTSDVELVEVASEASEDMSATG